MKNSILFTAFLISSLIAFSQSSTLNKKWTITTASKITGFVEHGGFLEPSIYIENISGSTIDFEWMAIPGHTLDCHGANYSICDYGQCYPGIPTGTNFMDPLASGEKAFFKLMYFADTSTQNCCGEVTFVFWDKTDLSVKDTVGFKMCVTPASVKETEINNNIIVYPNPASTKFVLNKKNESDIISHIQLHDITGRIMTNEATYSPMNTVDVSAFSKGMYLLSYKLNNIEFTKPIIIE